MGILESGEYGIFQEKNCGCVRVPAWGACPARNGGGTGWQWQGREVHIHVALPQLHPLSTMQAHFGCSSSSSKALIADFVLQLGLTNNQLPLQAGKHQTQWLYKGPL